MVVLSLTLITTVSFHFIQKINLTPIWNLCANVLFFLMLPIFESQPTPTWGPLLGFVIPESLQVPRCPTREHRAAALLAQSGFIDKLATDKSWYQESSVLDVPITAFIIFTLSCFYTWKWMNASAPFKQAASLFYQHCHFSLGYQTVYIHQSQKWTLVHREILAAKNFKKSNLFLSEKKIL